MTVSENVSVGLAPFSGSDREMIQEGSHGGRQLGATACHSGQWSQGWGHLSSIWEYPVQVRSLSKMINSVQRGERMEQSRSICLCLL